MDICITPSKLNGNISVIPSKSQAHRYLICAAFSDNDTDLHCPETNRDIEATVACLNALGAEITRTTTGYHVTPAKRIPVAAVLPCGESGSTLRFLLPVAGALGVNALFQMRGRLPNRPLSPLWEEMERMGCRLSRPAPDTIRCTGRLKSGDYYIDGSISSQFISGLEFALPFIPGGASSHITGKTESRPYVEMTRQAKRIFQAPSYHSPGYLPVEGDWSNGAFFHTAKALGSDITIENLNSDSCQGDRVILDLLKKLENHCRICAADTPDLIPILSIMAACRNGAVFTDIRRLRLKESDRVASIIAMLEALGGKAAADENTLTVFGTGLRGGTVDCFNDHRIAMSAAVAATVCTQQVILLGAECIEKSYPNFFEEYGRLGGKYEQYLR